MNYPAASGRGISEINDTNYTKSINFCFVKISVISIEKTKQSFWELTQRD